MLFVKKLDNVNLIKIKMQEVQFNRSDPKLEETKKKSMLSMLDKY